MLACGEGPKEKKAGHKEVAGEAFKRAKTSGEDFLEVWLWSDSNYRNSPGL